VSVINDATSTVTATPLGNNPVGVAVNPFTGRVYVTNAFAASLSVIDGASNTVTATIPVGNTPIAVAANPFTGRVYVTNRSADSVSVINDQPSRSTPTSTSHAP
jgi:YVTN family beta-propeller protein